MSIKSNPLNENQLKAFNQLVEELSPNQLFWISGYLEGRLAAAGFKTDNAVDAATVVTHQKTRLTVLYGTETGKSQKVAEELAKKAGENGAEVNLVSLYDYKPKSLKDEENVAVIVSTHGEGEPPDMAEDFYSFITGKRAPELKHVKFGVLALGDKSYRFFCKTGEDIYNAFEKLGAQNLTPLVKCDVDYEDDATTWVDTLVQKLKPYAPAVVETNQERTQATSEYSKKHPFLAPVLEKVKITGRDSDKEVYHFELSLEGSGLSYEPGDSVGIFTRNPNLLVERILNHSSLDPGQKVNLKIGEVTLKDALTYHLEITVLSVDILQKYYNKTQNEALKEVLDNSKILEEFLYGTDFLDLLEDFPYAWEAQDLVDLLRPLPPRLYSISSSQESVGDEVHATIAIVRYTRKERDRLGACSTHLADRVVQDEKIPLYIEKNPAFKLPANGAKIIMVGAGTGVAPYRAFLQHRESQGKKGNTWLFFGERRFQSDFLYQVEWQKLLKSNHLERMDVAFSRDQKEKHYVQHRLKEQQKEVYEWLENGAHLYLCGDMKHMAKDVNRTLLDIIQDQGGKNIEEAQAYVKQLKKEKRFQTDVY
ncbi:assimilatory sulfite reductase (NADPH) flavoprotein subunit [Saccharicrinis sp. FJH54]|uniref:assimilatory sulfite reductase (NADPH) flavoprotein subunit n=1 Tax=Saccharicrinis sp. FJH54 TaxID=3344665 RepID=UPI0035D43B7B